MRSWTLSPAKSPNKLGEDVDGTDHANSTAETVDNQTGGKMKEDETDQMGDAPPPESSGSLPADYCCEFGRLSACKTHRCVCWKVGRYCTDYQCIVCANVPSPQLGVHDTTMDGGGGGRRRLVL